jgi:hypothetical protein
MENLPIVQKPFQFRLRTLFLLVAVVGVISGCFAYVQLEVQRAYERRFIADRDEWLEPLKELLAEAAAEHIDVEPVEYFHPTTTWDPSFVARMKASDELLALVTQKWRLGPAAAYDVERLWRDIPPEWAKPDLSAQRVYYAMHISKADNFIVMVDESAGLLYAWFWFDF